MVWCTAEVDLGPRHLSETKIFGLNCGGELDVWGVLGGACNASPAPSPGQEVELADGNRASVGDLIITRRNDRRLRITATDWVKNGDRWIILNLTRTGGVKVRHVQEPPHRDAPRWLCLRGY